ncbi:MAG: response regulator [Deltaproteobacteria bacterium]|nr:response regulator [Deltaproteobacteria bacterium]
MSDEIIRVIVVDDDQLQLELIERALSRDGFEVHAATTSAVMADHAKVHTPHMILMDINMPGSTPEETIAIARASSTTARVILYSAWEASRLRALAAQLGADGFISKSESVITLGKRLRELQG